MSTNLELELKALEQLQEAYQNAVKNDASFITLMDLQMRINVIKEMCNDDIEMHLDNNDMKAC